MTETTPTPADLIAQVRKVWPERGLSSDRHVNALIEALEAVTTELESARTTLEEDKRYLDEADQRMKLYLAKAWDDGFEAGYRTFDEDVVISNPYRKDNQ